METYFKLKIIFEYVVPFALLAVCALPWIYLFGMAAINDWKKKRREKRKHGEVRKEDDAV